MVEFVEKTGLKVRLIYYPPYHSKYNPVERLWGILENHWNGEILNATETALEWARSMTWNKISPIVHLLTTVYTTGKTLVEEEMKIYEAKIERNEKLSKWDVTIPLQNG